MLMKSMAAETKETTKAQKALAMKAKLNTLLDEAKAETLEAVNQGIKDLGELGFVYRLVTEEEYIALNRPQIAPQTHNMPSRNAPKATPKAKEPPATPHANFNPDKKCDICNMISHDGRQHRLHKEKFTDVELAERGLMPPPDMARQTTF
jgi:hypothetical protein